MTPASVPDQEACVCIKGSPCTPGTSAPETDITALLHHGADVSAPVVWEAQSYTYGSVQLVLRSWVHKTCVTQQF